MVLYEISVSSDNVLYTCVRACVRAYVRACVRMCVRACMPMSVRACVRVCMYVCGTGEGFHLQNQDITAT